MNAALNSILLWRATCCTFFLVNPCSASNRQMVETCTVIPVTSCTLLTNSERWRSGEAIIRPITYNLWWLSSLRRFSLLVAGLGSTSPVSWKRLKILWAVPTDMFKFLAIFLKGNSNATCCHTTLHLKSLAYGAVRPGSAYISCSSRHKFKSRDRWRHNNNYALWRERPVKRFTQCATHRFKVKYKRQYIKDSQFLACVYWYYNIYTEDLILVETTRK